MFVRTYIYSTFNNIQYWPDINQNNTLERTGGISTNMCTYSRTRSWGFPTCARLINAVGDIYPTHARSYAQFQTKLKISAHESANVNRFIIY